MARHEVKIHANNGATSEKAPFTGSYITKSTVGIDAICATAASLVGMPELKLKNIVQNAIEAFLDWEREGACRIHVDGGYVEIKLLGSFPAADSPWDPARNRFVVVFVPDAETRDFLINETPVIVTDETSTKVRVDNVFDADPAKAKPTEVIYGQDPFVSQGYNQVMSDPGAKAELVNARGVRFDCTVLEEMNRQNVKFKTADLLEAGDYRFMLTSRGGDADGDLQTVMKKVKYLKVEPPAEPPTVTSGSFDTELVTGTEWSCDGTHLKGCKVHLVQRDEETEEVIHDKTLVESYVGADTHFAITVTNADVTEFESGVIVELTFTNAAGSANAGLMLDKRE